MSGWSNQWRETDSLTRVLRQAVQDCPDRTYLDFAGEAYSYARVWELGAQVAGGLRDAGIGRGDTVVSMLDNNVDAVASWFGTNLVGGIWVGINTALKGEFLRHVVADTGARLAICEPDFVERFAAVADGLPDLRALYHRGVEPGGDAGPRLALAPMEELRTGEPDEEWFDADPSDPICIVYTGGTTGPSKGCVISGHYMFNTARRAHERSGRTSDETSWSPLPIFHFNLTGLSIAGTALLQSTAAISPRFSVSGFWPEIERSGANVVYVVGAMPSMIARMPDTPEMRRCKGQVRAVYAAPFSAQDQATWRERFGTQLAGANVYGLTEASPIMHSRADEEGPPGSSGRPNLEDFDVRLFDEHEREVAPGEVGEVVCRPKRRGVIFEGYWGRPDATLGIFQDLWLHTGDLGRLDENGFFHFMDRKKDYLRRRGENISSQELENVYLLHEEIAEVAVHAVPDLADDEVKVTAVLAQGSMLSEAELFEWSKERMPYFALPRYIEFRKELPRSAFGRVFKYQLRDEGVTAATWDRETAGVEWERR